MSTIHTSDNPTSLANTTRRESIGSFLGTFFSIVTFNIGDIYGDDEWNVNRWQRIMTVILARQSDIIVLHEINDKSGDFFEKLTEYGYTAHAPYVLGAPYYHKRNNWEVIYSKIPISHSSYFLLPFSQGISYIRGFVEYKDRNRLGLNILVATWNPNSCVDISVLVEQTITHVDPKAPSIMIVSMKNYGSYAVPPKFMNDVWTMLGSPENSAITMNSQTCVYVPSSNLRADHVWVNNIKPRFMNPINDDTESEHIGLHIGCVFDMSCVISKIPSRDSEDDSGQSSHKRIFNFLTPRRIQSLPKPIEIVEPSNSVELVVDSYPLISRSKTDTQTKIKPNKGARIVIRNGDPIINKNEDGRRLTLSLSSFKHKPDYCEILGQTSSQSEKVTAQSEREPPQSEREPPQSKKVTAQSERVTANESDERFVMEMLEEKQNRKKKIRNDNGHKLNESCTIM